MTDLRRPALRWHGGKWRLAPWIIQHFPPHRIYVEPFGGAGSVLLRKPRSYSEVYNDLDSEVVTLFRVLRNRATAEELIHRLRLTPFAREEFEASDSPGPCEIERARALIIRSFMGFGSDATKTAVRTGFRGNSNRSGTTPAHDWANYPDALAAIVERLQGVVIEHRDASRVMQGHDGPDTLHYLDPPYPLGTRSTKNGYHGYTHELTDADHLTLLDLARSLSGMVVISSYPSALYDQALADWTRVERSAHADGARDRTEVLWLSPAAMARRGGLL